MDELSSLLLDCLHDSGVTVSRRFHSNACNQGPSSRLDRSGTAYRPSVIIHLYLYVSRGRDVPAAMSRCLCPSVVYTYVPWALSAMNSCVPYETLYKLRDYAGEASDDRDRQGKHGEDVNRVWQSSEEFHRALRHSRAQVFGDPLCCIGCPGPYCCSERLLSHLSIWLVCTQPNLRAQLVAAIIRSR